MRTYQYPKNKKAIRNRFSIDAGLDINTEQAVRQIIEDVRRSGDKAVTTLTKKFDNVTIPPSQFEVSPERLKDAWDNLPARLKKALRTAHKRIRAYHKRQLVKGFTYRDPLGNRMDQRVTALQRAGVYVPGGRASYPSTVLMDVVPARTAGVGEVVLLMPPGLIDNPGGQAALGAAHLAGVDRAFAVGGTPGVVALGVGTQTIPKCDIIVGPGNKFIAMAKRLLYGEIVIDMVAGPSEIFIIADNTADPAVIASDMLSQAEHDPDAQSIAVLVGNYDVKAFKDAIAEQTRNAPRRAIIEESLKNNGMIIQVDTPDEAIELANLKAPEHLEIIARGARRIADRIPNVGAIFLGPRTPEAMGDYVAGPNHTLPTGGTARFFSPLSVWSFLKTSHVVECSRKGFDTLADDVITLAEVEQLNAHAQAVRIRKK